MLMLACCKVTTEITGSPSAVVVLKHENLILRQRHNLISMDLKLGVGDHVRDYQPCQIWFGSDERSRRHMGNIYGSCDF